MNRQIEKTLRQINNFAVKQEEWQREKYGTQVCDFTLNLDKDPEQENWNSQHVDWFIQNGFISSCVGGGMLTLKAKAQIER